MNYPTTCILCFLLMAGFSLRASTIPLTEGSLEVQTSTSIFVSAAATGDACVTGELGGAAATAALYVSPTPAAATGFGAAVGCTNKFFVPSANQPSIFYTLYDLKNYNGFEGNTPAAKFPAPVTADDRVQAKGPLVQGSSVFTNAEGLFSSSQTSVGGVVLFRSAKLTSQAQVDTSNGQTGIATAETYDPWFFTPESDSYLTLQVNLQDVDLEADAGTASILLVQGAFGLGSIPGENIMATFNQGSFIGVTDG